MRYGYWMPVFGGWLRNVPDEGMRASWDYVKRLTQRSEQWGYDLSLIAELNLNDIKGVEQPALDAWSTAAALAAVTDRIELMVAVRPNFHHPALFAKAAANIDRISNGRLALNVVSSWWADEARQYGLQFDQHAVPARGQHRGEIDAEQPGISEHHHLQREFEQAELGIMLPIEGQHRHAEHRHTDHAHPGAARLDVMIFLGRASPLAPGAVEILDQHRRHGIAEGRGGVEPQSGENVASVMGAVMLVIAPMLCAPGQSR